MRPYVLAICCLLLAGCGSCKDEPPPRQVERPPEPEVEPDVEPVHPLMKLRQAYGLPLPPEVVTVRKRPGFIAVQTELDLDELEGFFRKRLVDYEFFRPHQTKLEIVGLRAHMPRITATAWGRHSPVTVRYIEAAEPESPPSADVGAGVAGKTAPSSYEKGDPVEVKTPDGRDLAPGARWGEPYTPPPGSPLFKQRYRANFGKPFGEWTLN